METGFLNKHDSEYFSSDVTYEQGNVFESEGSLFSSFVNEYNNDFDEYQWVVADEEHLNDTSLNVIPNETAGHQEELKSFNDWQQHISDLKLREDVLSTSNLFSPEKMPEIFPSCSPRQLSSPPMPSLIDDPLNPDLLLEELAATTDSPLSPPCIDNVKTNIQPKSDHTAFPYPPKHIKQEHVDIFPDEMPPADLLDVFSPQIDSQSVHLPPDTSAELGPDNYDVVDIKAEDDDDDDDDLVDVETVSDSIPVIEATDINILLDQFEATERVNTMCKNKRKDKKHVREATAPVLSTPKVPPIIIKKMNSKLKVEQAPFPPLLKVCPPTASSAKAGPLSVPPPKASVLTIPSLKVPPPSIVLKVPPSHSPSPKVSPSYLPSPKASPLSVPSPNASYSSAHSPKPLPVSMTSPKVLVPSAKLSPPSISSPKASPSSASSPSASPFSMPKSGPINKTIMDSLPQEVIDRIKKSSSKKKKIVPVVPAERLPSKGNSHMKDVGASKAIMRDTVNKKKVKTENAQVDHDYCTNENDKSCKDTCKMDTGAVKVAPPPTKPPVTVIVDAFSVTEEDKWVLDNEQKLLASVPTASPSPSEASSNARNSWEKNSKKDSGLESGDVSDASESPSDKKCPPKIEVPTENFDDEKVKVEKEDCSNTPQVLSENHTEVPNLLHGMNQELAYEQDKDEPKKKKLNLDEYRSRRKFARLSSPIKTGTIGEAIMSNKWVQRSPKNPAEEQKPIEEKITRISTTEVCMEASPRKYDDDKRRRNSRSRDRIRPHYRQRSSSSSSSGSRVRSSRLRGRSRDKKRPAVHRSRSRGRNFRPRSSSGSSSSSSRSSSSRSRSGSGSRSRSSRGSRYRARSRSRSRSCYRRRTSTRRYSQRFSTDRAPRRADDWSNGERMKQVEERRVIYVGQIEEGTTKAQLRERFQCFGPIVDISLHFRERGDNYGFVTFAYKGDAYKAVEHGNDNPMETHYDICFGGRRAFCKQRYADLDSTGPQNTYSPFHQSRSNESFDTLLRAAREKILRSQKTV